MTTDSDMVRVQWHATYSDAINGTVFRNGLSDPMPRSRAERFLARLGPPAVLVEADTPSEPASPVSEPPPSTDAGDAALDLSSDMPAPSDAGDVAPSTDTAPKPRKTPR